MDVQPLITGRSGVSALQGVLSHQPQLLHYYQEFYLRLWRDPPVPLRVLELCRVRIAQIHGAQAELAVNHAEQALSVAEKAALARVDTSNFAAAEQVALALAEQMPFNHHGISDQQVAAAVAEFGEAGGVALLTALAFFDVTCRLKLVWALPVEPAFFNGEKLC